MESYDAIKVNWKKGHAPELHIYDNGERTEVISLTEQTVDGLHEMLASKGFSRTMPEPLEQLDDEPGEASEEL